MTFISPTSDDTLASDLEALRRDGFLVLHGLLNADDVRSLADELEPWLRRTPRCEGDFHGWSTTRVNGLLSKAPMVQQLALHPRILRSPRPCSRRRAIASASHDPGNSHSSWSGASAAPR